jgi:hypothetical protein
VEGIFGVPLEISLENYTTDHIVLKIAKVFAEEG